MGSFIQEIYPTMDERESQMDGIVPVIPSSLDGCERDMWVEGLEFETDLWTTLQLQPQQHLADYRQSCVRWLCKNVDTCQITSEMFCRAVLTVDLTLTLGVTVAVNPDVCAAAALHLQNKAVPLQMTMAPQDAENARTLADKLDSLFQAVYGWPARCVHTAQDWLRKMAAQHQLFQEEDLCTMKEAEVTLIKVLSSRPEIVRYQPSAVAAAVLRACFGEEAEEFLCGYDYFDYCEVLSYL